MNEAYTATHKRQQDVVFRSETGSGVINA